MKKLLTLLFFACSAVTFAAVDTTTEQAEQEVKLAEKKHTTGRTAAGFQTPTAAHKEPATQSQKTVNSAGTTKACTTAERPPFGLSGYFVDFVHRNNVKLVNMLLD